VVSVSPAVVRATVHHRRTRPFDYSFEHRTTSWLVDAHDPERAFPRWLRRFASIRGADHLRPGPGTLTEKLQHLLRAQQLDWSAHTVKVLVGARTAGYVFNPLTTWFCFRSDGALEGILAEVHNTYGEAYVYSFPNVETSWSRRREGAATVTGSAEKEMYVSPFFAVEGRYDVRARLTDDDVAVAITLTQGEEQVFSGSVHGPLVPATRGAVLRALLRDPFAAQRVALLIRWHGVRLWLRRLPVVPRRPHQAPRGMA
jgi:uncharacterized protein